FKAELHVLDISTNEDEIVGKGGDVVGGFADFEISGSDIVWSAGGDTIWRNTTGCSPDPSPCDHSGNKTAFETVAGHYLHSPSIGGGRVAWVDCAFPGEGPFCGTPDDDIYTATIAD